MNITPLRTKKIKLGESIFLILNHYLPAMKERSILTITSKIVALAEGSAVPSGSIPKEKLIQQESDYYILNMKNRHNVILTIKKNILIPSSGIDESNGNGYYVLWPHDAQRTANKIRGYLCHRFGLKQVGVIITDSTTKPLRRGTTGIGLAHSGFRALNNYVGLPDLFGRKLKMTQANALDGLAAAAVMAMGEGSEQTPLAIIDNIPFCRFQQRNPTTMELRELIIEPQDDIYAPLLGVVKWKKGKKNKKGIGK